jgi:hypothetical protein
LWAEGFGYTDWDPRRLETFFDPVHVQILHHTAAMLRLRMD